MSFFVDGRRVMYFSIDRSLRSMETKKLISKVCVCKQCWSLYQTWTLNTHDNREQFEI